MPETAMTAPLAERRFADPRSGDTDASSAEPRRLKHWTAYRSGAALSVSGMDAETDSTMTITGVSSLGPDAQGGVFITDATDQRWELLL